MDIKPGERVLAVNARGEHSERVALTGIVQGRDFAVVWICTPAEWEAAASRDREPSGVPWPAEDVSPLADARR